MGTDAVLSGASQRADAHHRRFSRSPRLASLILSPSLPPNPSLAKPPYLVISIQQQPSRETDHQPHPVGCSDTSWPVRPLLRSLVRSFACQRRILSHCLRVLPVTSDRSFPVFTFPPLHLSVLPYFSPFSSPRFTFLLRLSLNLRPALRTLTSRVAIPSERTELRAQRRLRGPRECRPILPVNL